MSAVRTILNSMQSVGVLGTVDFATKCVSFEPRNVLSKATLTEIRSNKEALTVWLAVSTVLDPSHLGVLLDWVSRRHSPDLYFTEEQTGKRLSEAWLAGGRTALFEALRQWVDVLRIAYTDALEDNPALLEQTPPIWMWWTRYTARGSAELGPLSNLFACEVGLPNRMHTETSPPSTSSGGLGVHASSLDEAEPRNDQ